MVTKNNTTKKIVVTALLAALTVAGSALRITLPIDIGGNTSFHLGNIFCALAGLLLGPWYGGLAAGIGSAIYDCLNPLYIAECWITFLTKGAYALVTGLLFWNVLKSNRAEKPAAYRMGAANWATSAGAVTYALLYLLKSYLKGVWVNGLTHEAAMVALAAKLPATIFNGVVAIIFAPILYVAVKPALDRNHLSF